MQPLIFVCRTGRRSWEVRSIGIGYLHGSIILKRVNDFGPILKQCTKTTFRATFNTNARAHEARRAAEETLETLRGDPS